MLYFIFLLVSLFLRAGVDFNCIYAYGTIYIDCCIYFKSTFSRSTFGLYLVVPSATTLFPTQRGGNVWLERVSYIDNLEYFFFDSFCQSVSSHQSYNWVSYLWSSLLSCNGVTGLSLSKAVFVWSLMFFFLLFSHVMELAEDATSQRKDLKDSS